MKTVNISVALDKSSPTKILLGRQGENKATKIIFDCNVYAKYFGAGTAYLFHQRAPDTCPYPVAIEQDGNTIMWEVSASDTQFAGQGQCELFWYVDDIIAKTQVWSTTVTEALTGTESEEVPEAAQGWVSKVLQAIADIGKVNDEVVKAAVAAYIAENGLPDTGGVGFTSWSYDTDTGYIHLYNEDGEEAIEPLYAPGLGFADLTEDELQQVNTILTRASNYAAQAGQAKEAASASAENATKSAQDAATSAERATQSASAAATSETNASQSASSAAADADLAKQYNDSALKAAGEAAQSLSGAQDAAETAQEAAQDAIAARDGFKVDTTLSQSGQAADAKAVGDALSSLSDEIANLQTIGLTTAQINALDGMFKVCAFIKDDVSAEYTEFKTAFGIADSGGGDGDPDEPVTPDVTLTSISATYSGGDVAVGTAVADLTGIVVTAHYSDGASKAVTGYTLDGTIAEGENTVTVIYGGKMTEFVVVGVAESGGEVIMLKNISFDGTSYLDTEVIPESVNYRYVLGIQAPSKDVVRTKNFGGISARNNTSLAASDYWDIYWYASVNDNSYNTDVPKIEINQSCMGLAVHLDTGQDKGDGASSQPYENPLYYNFDNGSQSVWIDEDCSETPVAGYFATVADTVDFTNQTNFTDDEHPIDSIWLGKVHVTGGTMSSLATEANTYAGAKFYCFKVYDADENQIADMKPAKQGGTVGMWDNIRNKFYPATVNGGAVSYEEVSV